mgnify:FL=1
MKISFCLHNHQPVGNFQHVMESAYRDCYLPMMEVLRSHTGFRTGLHISGTLLEWLERFHPEYVGYCSELCGSGRMELLTGGRYEPILPVFRREDIRSQIEDFSGHLESISGSVPEGLWLTERVWEPGLASLLPAAGIRWAVVDDLHLRRAGAAGSDLYGPCMTEDSGMCLRLLASDMKMRYMIPFSPVEDVIGQLRACSEDGAELVFYGDDGEKFGVWPGTGDLCYGRGWLNDFISAILQQDWLEVVLPSAAASMPASGPFYVPACSYFEMGEWTVPPGEREDYGRALRLMRESGLEGSAKTLLPGGFWRNFLSRYPESKELHGRILAIEDTVRSSRSEEALHHFWRSQCNCAFWHGVFGGVYLPHLREAVWKELVSAEYHALKALDGHPMIRSVDLNADGFPETIISANTHSLAVLPHRGLTVSDLTFIHGSGEPVPVGHTLSRRPEPYHDELPEASAPEGAGTIHGRLGAKEEGLAERIVYDGWPRVMFSDLLLPPGSVYSDWSCCTGKVSLPAQVTAEPGPSVHDGRACFRCRFRLSGASACKELTVGLHEPVLRSRTEISGAPGARAGIELCFNLMTGASRDRTYRIDDGEELLMSAGGQYRGSVVHVLDRWRRLSVRVDLGGEVDIWVAPMDSVNRSESGFESVHQGTAFLASRTAEDDGTAVLEAEVRLEAPE